MYHQPDILRSAIVKGAYPNMFSRFFQTVTMSDVRWWLVTTEQCSKIPLSFHYTGGFIGIPLLDDYNPQCIG